MTEEKEIVVHLCAPLSVSFQPEPGRLRDVSACCQGGGDERVWAEMQPWCAHARDWTGGQEISWFGRCWPKLKLASVVTTVAQGSRDLCTARLVKQARGHAEADTAMPHQDATLAPPHRDTSSAITHPRDGHDEGCLFTGHQCVVVEGVGVGSAPLLSCALLSCHLVSRVMRAKTHVWLNSWAAVGLGNSQGLAPGLGPPGPGLRQPLFASMGIACSLCQPERDCVVKEGSDAVHSTVLQNWSEPEPETQCDTLLRATEHYGGLWVQQLRDAARTARRPTDMIIVGDFGVDVDDEKALCLAVALLRIGVVRRLSVVANTGDSTMRARLAKGTLQALGAGDVPVATGGSGPSLGCHGEFEFDCRYLASQDELDPRGGHELIFAALADASRDGRQVCIVLNSALSDMFDVLQDSRWNTMRRAVNNVTVMGGAMWKGGMLVVDPFACNNFIDLNAATAVYARLSQEVPLFVVSRHAAAQVQLSTSTFHGSLHPVAQRLMEVALKSTQAFWERLHGATSERTSGTLPHRCDLDWFYKTFLCCGAPRILGPQDRIWPFLRGLHVYDGLATLVSVYASLDQVDERFDVVRCNVGTSKLIGVDERRHGITHTEHINKLVLDLLVMVMGGGNGAWWRRMGEVAQKGKPVDLIMIGDFGKDLDDEKALCVAVAMRRLGLVGHLNVISNLGCSIPRGRLAKGTLQALGAGDCSVAAGSHGGQPNEELYSHEFEHAGYLAPAADLDERSATDLVFSVLEEAKAAQRNVCITLNSALTDMDAVLEDPRWDASRDVVSAIAAMGGVNQQEDGTLVMDPTAANNAFDLRSAERVYSKLQSKKNRNPPFIVVSRHAASSCQMPRGALDGSKHPVALRFVGVSEPALQKLWERCFRTKAEREAVNDSLPMRCDDLWFRKTFLVAGAPSLLQGKDEIWSFVKGFNEYDALTTIVVGNHLPPCPAAAPLLFRHCCATLCVSMFVPFFSSFSLFQTDISCEISQHRHSFASLQCVCVCVCVCVVLMQPWKRHKPRSTASKETKKGIRAEDLKERDDETKLM